MTQTSPLVHGGPTPARVLIIEDSDTDFRLLQRHLQREGLAADVRQAASAAAVDAALQEGGWQLVLTDHQLPGIDFDALLARLRQELPDAPVILVTGTIGEELAVDLLHQGVSDFVLKDRMARLGPAIRRCLDDQRRRRDTEAAARALADSEAFNRTIIGAIGDGLFLAQDQRFVFTNPALPALLGYDAADFIERRFEEVVAAESLSTWNERFSQRVQPELPEPEGQYDVALLHRDGQVVWTELRATRFEYRGRPAVLGLLRDQTVRRRVMAELQQHRHHLEALVEERTQKAEAANRAKSSFLANMSHEIRTPLNAITGMVHLMQRELTDPQQQRRLRAADDAARHLLSLVDGVLDMSKIESGKLTLETIDFDLDALVGRTCALVADLARSKGLQLQVDNRAAGARLRGDPTRLAQVLLNLLGNAVKFTDHGAVQLTCSLDTQDPAHPLLSMVITDTGIGIAPQRLEQLFNAFEQADNSTTRRFGGSGLGLAICRHLAGLMHGEVSVSSELGKGSVFRFTARLQAADPADLHPGEPPAEESAEQLLRSRHQGRRVLLAEDNLINQMVASELLQAVGLWVDLAENGVQAIELASKVPYAAILMDVQMPQLDGLEAARAIRRMPGAASQVPILAMTANAFNEERTACLAAGMNDHIAKPVVPERMYQQLLHWLDAASMSPA